MDLGVKFKIPLWGILLPVFYHLEIKNRTNRNIERKGNKMEFSRLVEKIHKIRQLTISKFLLHFFNDSRGKFKFSINSYKKLI